MKNKPRNHDQRQDKLDKIKSAKKLVAFLEENARTHRRFYHYTTLDSLKMILKNRTLRLSKGSQMNDLQELTKGSRKVWEKTYISSFSYGSSENIAMWTMYGIPWARGVRISFAANEFIKWIDSIEEVEVINEDNGKENEILNIDKFDVKLTDVIYTEADSDNENEFTTEILKFDKYKVIDANKQLGLPNLSKEENTTGYIKNRAWEFENETRIKIVRKENDIANSKISIDLNDEVLKTLEITLNPWYDINPYMLEEIVSLHKEFDLKYGYSKFTKLLNINAKCSYCGNDFTVYGQR